MRKSRAVDEPDVKIIITEAQPAASHCLTCNYPQSNSVGSRFRRHTIAEVLHTSIQKVAQRLRYHLLYSIPIFQEEVGGLTWKTAHDISSSTSSLAEGNVLCEVYDYCKYHSNQTASQTMASEQLVRGLPRRQFGSVGTITKVARNLNSHLSKQTASSQSSRSRSANLEHVRDVFSQVNPSRSTSLITPVYSSALASRTQTTSEAQSQINYLNVPPPITRNRAYSETALLGETIRDKSERILPAVDRKNCTSMEYMQMICPFGHRSHRKQHFDDKSMFTGVTYSPYSKRKQERPMEVMQLNDAAQTDRNYKWIINGIEFDSESIGDAIERRTVDKLKSEIYRSLPPTIPSTTEGCLQDTEVNYISVNSRATKVITSPTSSECDNSRQVKRDRRNLNNIGNRISKLFSKSCRKTTGKTNSRAHLRKPHAFNSLL